LGALPSFKNINYIRMHHFEKKNSRTFSPEGPTRMFGGSRENVSSGHAVALDGPVYDQLITKMMWTAKSEGFTEQLASAC